VEPMTGIEPAYSAWEALRHTSLVRSSPKVTGSQPCGNRVDVGNALRADSAVVSVLATTKELGIEDLS
jgi:hypothetical protein